MSAVLDAAIEYAARGWHVFPVRFDGKVKKSWKSADTSNGRNWGMTNDAGEIRRDFADARRSAIGIPTGAINGIFVVETDTVAGHGVDGEMGLMSLEARYGKLPDTLMSMSPSGSIHYWFNHPGAGIKIKNSASEIAPGVDVRGDGGMVVAPPSIRPDYDQPYIWLNVGTDIADAPGWLIALIAQKERAPDGERITKEISIDADDAEIAAALTVIPSDNYQTWFEIGCALHAALGDAGYAVFDQWSSKSDKYRETECTRKWEECKKITGYTAGTIYYHAGEADPNWRSRYDTTVMEALRAAGRDPETHEEMLAYLDAAEAANVGVAATETADADTETSAAAAGAAEPDTGTDGAADADVAADAAAAAADAEPDAGAEPDAPSGSADEQPADAASEAPGDTAQQTDDNGAGASASATEQTNNDRPGDGGDAKANNERPRDGVILKSSATFVGSFTPPDYLIDGFLQRRFIYSLTGLTGSGKTSIALLLALHVAMGWKLASMDVEKGRVAYLVGENPDVAARWIKLCEVMKVEPTAPDVVWLKGNHPVVSDQGHRMITADLNAIGPIALLIVDTAAAFFTGLNENDNVQAGNYARELRKFVTLPGGPTVLVPAHPVKNAEQTNLVPRGGGAFLNEMDGNLACVHTRGTMLAEITTHGKFRGPEFAPISFKLVPGTSERLKDSKGRLIWTVHAEPVTTDEQERMEGALHKKRETLLLTMHREPGLSLLNLAKECGWTTQRGDPNKSLVQRLMKQLLGEKPKLVEKRGERYFLTAKGDQAIDDSLNGRAPPP